MRRAADTAKIKWKQNALRHSFISYRLAEIQDVNRVALEAGNSSQMIFRHYRELATPQQARTWFAITPEQAPNVVPISALSRKRRNETTRWYGGGGEPRRHADGCILPVRQPEIFSSKRG
jgi:hypothetical protein